MDLIAEKGEAGLRVVEVADRAGVSAASIYNYFANRDVLVATARTEQYVEAVDMDVRRIREVLLTAADPDAMVALMREVTQSASAADRAGTRWRRAEIIGAARHRPELAARLSESQHKVNLELASVARLGQERGLIDADLDPMALAVFVQAFTFGLLLADIDTHAHLDDRAWLDVVSRFTAAITAPAPKHPPPDHGEEDSQGADDGTSSW